MKTKFLGIVSENGYNDIQRIITRLQEKYGKDITIAELLQKLNKEVLILN